MLKRIFDRLFPNSAPEEAITEMCLMRLREAQIKLEEACREDRLGQEAWPRLQVEALACLVNSSELAIDLIGRAARRKPDYPGILAGTVLGWLGGRKEVLGSTEYSDSVRRCVRHLNQAKELCRSRGVPKTMPDGAIRMASCLVAASIEELGLLAQEGTHCELALMALVSDQSQAVARYLLPT